MSKYYVTTKAAEPMVSEEQKELILELPVDETIKNRFPFDDIERNRVEVYKISFQIACQQYIDAMPSQIIGLFKIEQYDQ